MVKIRRTTVRHLIGGVVLLTLIAAAIGWRGEARNDIGSYDAVGLPALICSGGKPNGICDAEEKAKGACPEDCGGGSDEGGGDSGGGASCDNDNICEPESGEATFNCGDCPPVCGDAICAAEEVDTCLDDCSVDVTCGDGLCSAFENEEHCALDCTGETEDPVQPANQPPVIPTITPTPGEDDPGASDAGELAPETIETPDDVQPIGDVGEEEGDVRRPDKQGEGGQDFDAATPNLTPDQNRGTFILIGLLAVGLIIIVCIGFLVYGRGLLLAPGSSGAQAMGGTGNDLTPPSSDGLMLADPRPSPSIDDLTSGGVGDAGFDGVDGEA